MFIHLSLFFVRTVEKRELILINTSAGTCGEKALHQIEKMTFTGSSPS